MNIKELKREIRQLKKLKLKCRSGSPERIELHRKIKDLKEQLKSIPIEIKEEPIKDTKVYKKVYYIGFLSNITRERFKSQFGIEFIDKCSLKKLEASNE